MENRHQEGSSTGRVQEAETALSEELMPLVDLCLNLNHDINNPLTGIIAYAEFLRDDPDMPEKRRRDYLDQILTCAERILECTGRLGSEKARLSEHLNRKL